MKELGPGGGKVDTVQSRMRLISGDSNYLGISNRITVEKPTASPEISVDLKFNREAVFVNLVM